MKHVDRQTLQRFWRVSRLFFMSEVRWKALGLLVLLATLSLSLSGLNVLRSYIDRDFMNALAQRDEARFFKEMSYYFLVFGGLVPLAVFYRYAEERLGLFWRDWLSRSIIDGYFHKKAYYRIGLERLIDNPDQRIEEDVRTFTVTTLSFVLIFFNSFVALIAFVSILWSISGTLMVGAIIYAVIGSTVTFFLGRPLIGLNFAQLRKEADYRYKLVNVRDFAEPIAFYRDEPRERLRVKDRLKEVIRNMRAIVDWNRNLAFFTNGYNYVLGILPIIIVAPLYLNGKIEFGVVIQAGGAFSQVLGALSIVVVHFGGLSSLAAVTNRLGPFWETIQGAHAAADSTESRVRIEESQELSFENVTLLTPDRGQMIVRDLTLRLEPRERLLVTGPSGSGKSSVFRLIGELWLQGSGVVRRPALKECMFLPQRPYMVLGNFRSQFLYATGREEIGEEELGRVLAVVGLEETFERVGGWDMEAEWKSLLSLGEQELIAFARVFISPPKMLFLDEATSAIDVARREVLYRELRPREIFYASVGAESDIGLFHDTVLELKGKGQWVQRKPAPRGVPA